MRGCLLAVVYLYWQAMLLGNSALAADPPGSERVLYCARAGTQDTPRPDLEHPGDYWRCMDGAVYVCSVGANLPCDARADRSKHNVGADNYCRKNPDAAIVPAYATGHRTIYEWHCTTRLASRGKSIAKLDRRGFRVDLWHRVN